MILSSGVKTLVILAALVELIGGWRVFKEQGADHDYALLALCAAVALIMSRGNMVVLTMVGGAAFVYLTLPQKEEEDSAS